MVSLDLVEYSGLTPQIRGTLGWGRFAGGKGLLAGQVDLGPSEPVEWLTRFVKEENRSIQGPRRVWPMFVRYHGWRLTVAAESKFVGQIA